MIWWFFHIWLDPPPVNPTQAKKPIFDERTKIEFESWNRYWEIFLAVVDSGVVVVVVIVVDIDSGVVVVDSFSILMLFSPQLFLHF